MHQSRLLILLMCSGSIEDCLVYRVKRLNVVLSKQRENNNCYNTRAVWKVACYGERDSVHHCYCTEQRRSVGVELWYWQGSAFAYQFSVSWQNDCYKKKTW